MRGRAKPRVVIPEGQRLLSIEQVAAACGVSRPFVYVMMQQGLRSVTLGRRRMVPVGELDRFIAEQLAEAEPA